MSQRDEILADSPTVFCDLNESSGTTAVDEGSAGLDATYSASNVTLGVAGLTGDGDTAALLSGGFATIPANAALNFGAGDFTVRVRYKGGVGGGTVLMGSTVGWWLGITSGVLHFDGGGAALTGSVRVDDNVAHDLVARRTAGVVALFVDGVADGTQACAGAVGSSGSATGIGAFEGGQIACAGTYDKVAVYKGVALSDARIAAHAAAAAGPPGMSITETSIDPHTTGVVIHLTGVGTAWDGGTTTFTVSGVAGVTKTAQSVASATAATVTVTTGTTAGTLTVSDGALDNTLSVSDRKVVLTNTTGGTPVMVIEPLGYVGGATAMVLYHHGNQEDRIAWNNETIKHGIRDRLLADGYLLAGISAGVTHWGNDAAMAKYADAHPFLLANWNVTYVVLVGQSMGGPTALRAMADPTTYTLVRGFYGIYPCCSPLAEYDAVDNFDAEILTAWGAADRTALVAAVAGKDPLTIPAGDFQNLRYRFHHSAGDTLVPKAPNTDAMRALLGGTDTIENSLVATSGNHGDTSNFDPDDISAFVAAALVVDTTPPTLSGWATNATGTQITVTPGEELADVDFAKLTLAGTSAVVGSYAAGGDPYTLFLAVSPPVAFGQAVTVSGAAGAVTDAAGNPSDAFDGVAVTNNTSALTAPTLAFVTATKTQVNLSRDAATGGAGSYTYNLHRSVTSGFTPGGGNLLASGIGTTYADTTATQAVAYRYKVVVVDAATQAAASNQVTAGLAFDGTAGASGPRVGSSLLIGAGTLLP